MNGSDLYIGTEWDSDPEDPDVKEMHGEALMQRKYGKIPRDVYFTNRALHDYLLGKSPEDEYKQEFLERAPSLGMTRQQIQRLRDTDVELVDEDGVKQKRRLFSILRSSMLRQMVPCDGASNLTELADALDRELDKGVAPPPSWYVFSKKNFGPRRIGLKACDNSGCFRVESEELKMSKCGSCSIPLYCSRECQKADWTRRHKHVCKKGKEERDKIKKTSELLERFKMSSEARRGGGGAGRGSGEAPDCPQS